MKKRWLKNGAFPIVLVYAVMNISVYRMDSASFLSCDWRTLVYITNGKFINILVRMTALWRLELIIEPYFQEAPGGRSDEHNLCPPYGLVCVCLGQFVASLYPLPRSSAEAIEPQSFHWWKPEWPQVLGCTIYICMCIYTVEVKSLHTPYRICKIFIILPSKKDHTKCMLLFI